MGDLQTKAMLASLHISAWTARRYDRKVSREMADAHGTTEKAGRYNKCLLPYEAESYDRVWRAAGAARAEHYEQTLPWSDEGTRILPATNYLFYVAEMRKRKDKFVSARTDFLAEYPSLHERSKAVLNGLYDSKDFPSAQELAGKFGFDWKFLPLPDAEDFRVSLQADEVEAIREQIDQDVRETVTVAVRDLYSRLYVAVRHMAERLGTKDAVFRDTLVDNLRQLCEIVPRLNLTADQSLEQARQEIEAELIVHSADALRESKRMRAKVAERAAKIEADLAAFMGR